MDLKYPANAKKSLDSRYMEKILTGHEIAAVRASPDSDVTLWAFWTCKEAAYKVLQKKSVDAAFMPRRWSVRYELPSDPSGGISFQTSGYADGQVLIPGAGPVSIRLFVSSDYIHCLAVDTDRALDRILFHVAPWSEDIAVLAPDASGYVRAILIRRLAVQFNLSQESLQIVRSKTKTGLGPPVLYVSGNPSAVVDISLSHDGRFVAYAYVS
ncbi:MAG: 4'-phosphopantetheinyl transferase superfamily protein [Smithellaceae bacterium]